MPRRASLGLQQPVLSAVISRSIRCIVSNNPSAFVFYAEHPISNLMMMRILFKPRNPGMRISMDSWHLWRQRDFFSREFLTLQRSHPTRLRDHRVFGPSTTSAVLLVFACSSNSTTTQCTSYTTDNVSAMCVYTLAHTSITRRTSSALFSFLRA